MNSACPCCLSEYTVTRDNLDGFFCSICGHRWRNSNLPKMYYAECSGRNNGMPYVQKKYLDRMKDVLPLLRQGMRVLEIGCADGYYGGQVKAQLPLHYAGLELSPDAKQAEVMLDEVFRQPTCELQIPPFDLLLSFHVLEHIADITSEIATWRRLLKPDGRLVMEVPHRAGHPWLADDHNLEHLHQFTQASLLLLLNNAGLHATQLSTGHFESVLYRDSLRIVAEVSSVPTEMSKKILKRIDALLPIPFVIFGIGGDFHNYIEPWLSQLRAIALCDNDPAKHGEVIGSYRIAAYDPITWRDCPILISSLRYGEAIRQYLRAHDVPDAKIVGLDRIYA